MDRNSPDPQEAERMAASHYRQAGDDFREFRQSGDEAALVRANEEIGRADAWEAKAKSGFERDGEADPSTSRRTWYKKGSVGDEPLQQLQEAEQDGSIFGQLVNYAARSVVDKEHRKFEGAKLTGKAVAAPVKGTAKAGKAAMKGVTGAAKGSKALAGATKAAGGAAARKGAILQAAATHKKGAAPSQRSQRGSRSQAPQQGQSKGQSRTVRKSKPAKAPKTPKTRDKGRSR